MSLALSCLLSEETRNWKEIKFIHSPTCTDEWMTLIVTAVVALRPRCVMMIRYPLTDWRGHLWSLKQVLRWTPGVRAALCGPEAFLPAAVGLAACYIKTGASVTESALWKLRGLADGHFWRSRSIIEMKSSDWAEMVCALWQRKSSSSSALLSLTASVCHRLLKFRVGGQTMASPLSRKVFPVCVWINVCGRERERESLGLKKSI